MVVNIKSINVTTSKSNEEVMPKLGNYLYAAKTLTLAVSQDTNIFINDSVEPVLVKSKYGLSIPVDMKMTIGSIIVESENTEVYAVFAY